jgi:hypothetical protein
MRTARPRTGGAICMVGGKGEAPEASAPKAQLGANGPGGDKRAAATAGVSRVIMLPPPGP